MSFEFFIFHLSRYTEQEQIQKFDSCDRCPQEQEHINLFTMHCARNNEDTVLEPPYNYAKLACTFLTISVLPFVGINRVPVTSVLANMVYDVVAHTPSWGIFHWIQLQ